MPVGKLVDESLNSTHWPNRFQHAVLVNSSAMNLLNTVESRDFGLACVLDIQCSNCGAINNVATGWKHGRVYDMNTKLALG
ncbi:hypothetical protein DPMN_007971 [Dreissena polymorpha]|uniref:Mutator-like transposase domain-containing protein n=1 Tax=Dreissena polymorpha TaxID=45954 RepID=A0A9D4MWU3_DREPO|nr:hypothetical protein DPMN_007971 [Dreissena polymorpha]